MIVLARSNSLVPRARPQAAISDMRLGSSPSEVHNTPSGNCTASSGSCANTEAMVVFPTPGQPRMAVSTCRLPWSCLSLIRRFLNSVKSSSRPTINEGSGGALPTRGSTGAAFSFSGSSGSGATTHSGLMLAASSGFNGR